MEIDPKRSLSQDQFCWLENISRAKFYQLKKRGLAPTVNKHRRAPADLTGSARRVARAHSRARVGRSCAARSRAPARTSRHRWPRCCAIAPARVETKTAKTAAPRPRWPIQQTPRPRSTLNSRPVASSPATGSGIARCDEETAQSPGRAIPRKQRIRHAANRPRRETSTRRHRTADGLKGKGC
jgi:hypothetical protein